MIVTAATDRLCRRCEAVIVPAGQAAGNRLVECFPCRVMSRVDRTGGPDACWPWTGSMFRTGYGSQFIDGTMRSAHRVVYELLVGPIPEGLELDHLCRRRNCVRPDHLEPVTHAENVRRGLSNSPAAKAKRRATLARRKAEAAVA